jgi:hypothetical protein
MTLLAVILIPKGELVSRDMEYVVDKCLQLDKPFMSDFQPTQPHPIKVTEPISNSNRADVKALENANTGKVTVVVAVMHLYGNAKSSSIKAKAKISAKKNKLESKLKELGLNQSKKHLKEAQSPPKDTSKRLIVKQKAIRVLLDTESSGDLLFLEKESNKYIPFVSRAGPELWSTSNGTFKTEKVGEVELSFVDYYTSKIGGPAPRYSGVPQRRTTAVVRPNH